MRKVMVYGAFLTQSLCEVLLGEILLTLICNILFFWERQSITWKSEECTLSWIVLTFLALVSTHPREFKTKMIHCTTCYGTQKKKG